MKIKTLIAVSGLALAATAQAGEEASAKQVIAPIAAICNWSWFAGGSVGVIDGDDWDEDIYTLHIGKERKCAGDKCSQAIYLEVGFTESDFVEEETSGSEVFLLQRLPQRRLKSFPLRLTTSMSVNSQTSSIGMRALALALH